MLATVLLCHPCPCCRRCIAIVVGKAAYPQPSLAPQCRAVEKPRALPVLPAAAPSASPVAWTLKCIRKSLQPIKAQQTGKTPPAFSWETLLHRKFATGVILHHSTKHLWTQIWNGTAYSQPQFPP